MSDRLEALAEAIKRSTFTRERWTFEIILEELKDLREQISELRAGTLPDLS